MNVHDATEQAFKNGYEKGKADALKLIEGEWILEKEPNGKPYCFHCSVCDDEFRRIDIKVKSPYCPNCGAKMKSAE